MIKDGTDKDPVRQMHRPILRTIGQEDISRMDIPAKLLLDPADRKGAGDQPGRETFRDGYDPPLHPRSRMPYHASVTTRTLVAVLSVVSLISRHTLWM